MEHVAVEPVAGEVDLRLDRAPRPEREQPGDRGSECRSTSWPTEAPSARA